MCYEAQSLLFGLQTGKERGRVGPFTDIRTQKQLDYFLVKPALQKYADSQQTAPRNSSRFIPKKLGLSATCISLVDQEHCMAVSQTHLGLLVLFPRKLFPCFITYLLCSVGNRVWEKAGSKLTVHTYISHSKLHQTRAHTYSGPCLGMIYMCFSRLSPTQRMGGLVLRP